jgi:hypothetical protein
MTTSPRDKHSDNHSDNHRHSVRTHKENPMRTTPSTQLGRPVGSRVSHPVSRSVVARRIAVACGAGVLLFGAVACGSSKSPSNANAAGGGEGGTTSQNGSQNGGQNGFQRPGADGLVAAVTGSTAQVQSQQAGQVAVTWSASTAFTKQVSAKLSDVKVGDCVVVTSATTGSGSSTTAPTAAPTAVTATTVRITAAVNGSCAGGFGGGTRPGGGFNGGGNGGGNGSGGTGEGGGGFGGGTPPSGAPTGGTGRGLRGGFGFGGGAFGTVKTVSGSGFVVSSSRPSTSAAGSSAGSSTSAGGTTADVTVTVGSGTTYTSTAKAAAADVKVGVCVRAEGKADSTGAIAATTIAVTPAVNGACTTGFVRNGSGTGTAGAGQAS